MPAHLKYGWTYEELALLLHAGIDPDVVDERPNMEWTGPLTGSPCFQLFGGITLAVTDSANTLIDVAVCMARGSRGEHKLIVDYLGPVREPFCKQVKGAKT